MTPNNPLPSKLRSKTKKAATAIGVQKTAKVTTTRVAKQATSSVKNPLAKAVLIAALGAVASYFIYKK